MFHGRGTKYVVLFLLDSPVLGTVLIKKRIINIDTQGFLTDKEILLRTFVRYLYSDDLRS